MKPSKLIKGFGVVLILLGLYWLIAMLISAVGGVLGSQDRVLTLVIEALFFAVMVAPAGFGLYFGWRLWTCPDRTSIKGGVGLVVVLGVMCVAFWIKGFLPKSYGEDLAMLVGAVFAIPIYVKTSRFLMARVGVVPKQKGEFVGKGIVLITALLTLNLMGSLVEHFVGAKKVADLIGSEWGVLSFIGAIYLIYLSHEVYVGYREAGAKEERMLQPNTETDIPKL
jgi:hypothetical protein